jgi:hypothetical protein
MTGHPAVNCCNQAWVLKKVTSISRMRFSGSMVEGSDPAHALFDSACDDSKNIGRNPDAAASLAVFAAMSSAQAASAKRPATKAATTQNVPEEYQAGIAQVRIAKDYLEKAGDKWGGYRVKGISSIDQAFKVFGVSPESTRDEMQSGNVDEPGMMDSGISSLQAGDDLGGRREKGLALVDQALSDLQKGIDWAREHQTYRSGISPLHSLAVADRDLDLSHSAVRYSRNFRAATLV